MRVLVTGASGFIGSALVPALRSRGHEVHATGRIRNFATANLAGEAAVHLANIAHTRASAEDLNEVNVEGTRRLAEQAAAQGIRRLVYVSSIKASGEKTGDRAFDGIEDPSPRDAYGKSKLAAEHALAEVARGTGLQTVVLRPPLVYGPGVKANFLALLRAIDSGYPLPFACVRNARSLVYVGNLVDAILRCLEASTAVGRTYVVCDGPPVSTPQLCRAIGIALSRPARLFPIPLPLLSLLPPLRPLLRDLVLDDSRLRDELVWKPPFSLEQGLLATATWYRAR